MTRLPFSLFISLRYFRGRHRHRFISLINLFSILGIALGVTALIVVLAVMGGFDRDLKKRILGVYAPVTIGGSQAMDNYQEVMEKLKDIPQIQASSPFVSGQILAQFGNRVYGVYIRAIDPVMEEKTTHIQEFVKQGSFNFDDKGSGRGIVIGNELARLFRLKLHDPVELLSPVSIPSPLGLSTHSLKFKIIGIFDSGMYDYDLNLVYISLKAGQELYALGKSVSGLTVRVDDLDAVFEVKKNIQDHVKPKAPVRTWLEMNKNLFKAILTEKWMMFWILLLIIVVAAFNIASSLIMMVMEKTKEIGILKAIGATSGTILRVFILQGFVIGLIGTVLGFAGGICLTLNLNTIADAVARTTGFQFFPKDVYYLDKIPALLDVKQALIVAGSALVLSLIAGIFPAFQASRLKPVESIRYE
jgi:lipoprotein-releasing system permease protein